MIKSSVELVWQPPDFDGGSPLTGYVIAYRDLTDNSTKEPGRTDCSTLRFKVENLQERRKYMFMVAAENKVGQSLWVETQVVEIPVHIG